MYACIIENQDGEEKHYQTDTLSKAVAWANRHSREGDKVSVYSFIDGLCGPEVQDLVLAYVEDGWKSYD